VLAAGFYATLKAWRGWKGGLPWPASGKSVPNLLFLSAIDLQFVLGALLYVVSPNVTAARANMAAAMKNGQLRFFTIEHGFMMLIATALVHIGFGKAKRGGEAAARYRVAFIFFGLALLLILAGVPWPGREAGRPLFRFNLS